MSTIQEQIGRKIRQLREQHGWKQEDLSERSGLHVTYVGGIERGERNATIEKFNLIAEAFGLNLHDLFRLSIHPLEEQFNSPYTDILEAVYRGFRAQVDVKGKLAELYLSKYLDGLKKDKVIEDYDWNDKDSLPDFVVTFDGKDYNVECKNVRSGKEGLYTREPSYKVEVQKTRNSKDGSNTRSYRVGYFDVLAACLFNQTSKWDFFFAASSRLERMDDMDFLKIFQRVPFEVQEPWHGDIISALKRVNKSTAE